MKDHRLYDIGIGGDYLWYGKDPEKMTKAELIDALRDCGRKLKATSEIAYEFERKLATERLDLLKSSDSKGKIRRIFGL